MAANSTTYGSVVNNGQLIPVFDIQQFASGNAQGPRLYGSIPNVPQTIPLIAGNAAVGGAPAVAQGSAGFALTPTLAVALIIMLVIGIAGLRYVHWRG